MNDLVVLVADKNMEAAISGALGRHDSLAIRSLDAEILVHPARDPGCLNDGHELLRPFSKRFRHGLIVLDREGSGGECETRERLEGAIEDRLSKSGWSDRAKAIVIDPELEIWVWSDSPHVPEALGWKSDANSLRQQLLQRNFLREGRRKPDRPKDAMEDLLRLKKKPRSSSIYLELARKVSLRHCDDPAFLKLKATLKAWFPV